MNDDLNFIKCLQFSVYLYLLLVSLFLSCLEQEGSWRKEKESLTIQEASSVCTKEGKLGA